MHTGRHYPDVQNPCTQLFDHCVQFERLVLGWNQIWRLSSDDYWDADVRLLPVYLKSESRYFSVCSFVTAHGTIFLQPVEQLSRERPLNNIFNFYVLLSVLLQFALHIATLIYITQLSNQFEQYAPKMFPFTILSLNFSRYLSGGDQ